jgi:phospholipid N-methyltransferase
VPFLLEFARDPMTVGAVVPSSPAVARLATATAFGDGQQRDALAVVVAALPPDGVFTTFAYVHARWAPPARRLLRSLRSRFDEVVVSQTVWANLSPASVYFCRRPKPDGGAT